MTVWRLCSVLVPREPGHCYWALPGWLIIRALSSRGLLSTQVGPFSSILSPNVWFLSLRIQWLRVLKLYKPGLGHWVSYCSLLTADDSIASVLLPKLHHQPSDTPHSFSFFLPHSFSCLGLSMPFPLPQIPFSILIIYILPSGFRWTSLYPESFPVLPVCISSACVWFLSNPHFFEAFIPLVITCIMSEIHAWGQELGLSCPPLFPKNLA